MIEVAHSLLWSVAKLSCRRPSRHTAGLILDIRYGLARKIGRYEKEAHSGNKSAKNGAATSLGMRKISNRRETDPQGKTH